MVPQASLAFDPGGSWACLPARNVAWTNSSDQGPFKGTIGTCRLGGSEFIIGGFGIRDVGSRA